MDNDRCVLCGKHYISHEVGEIICSCDENYCHGELTQDELDYLKSEPPCSRHDSEEGFNHARPEGI